MKKILNKIAMSLLVAAALAPLASAAATSVNISGSRSGTYWLGPIPYFVYGYNVQMDTQIPKPINAPVAPKLPKTGGGGAALRPRAASGH